MIYIILIMMVLFAIASIQTEVLRRAVIYAGVFSLLSSFAYLLYMAPDVAIAEAVIGCTLSTIIYLVALTKYKIFRVYYKLESDKEPESRDILKNVTRFADYMDMQLDIINTQMDRQAIEDTGNYDIIIIRSDNELNVYGDKSNYQYGNLVDFLNLTSEEPIKYHYIEKAEVEESI